MIGTILVDNRTDLVDIALRTENPVIDDTAGIIGLVQNILTTRNPAQVATLRIRRGIDGILFGERGEVATLLELLQNVIRILLRINRHDAHIDLVSRRFDEGGKV